MGSESDDSTNIEDILNAKSSSSLSDDDELSPVINLAHISPQISKALKPIYDSFYRKKYYIISASLSDDCKQIEPDPEKLRKALEDVTQVTPAQLIFMAEEYLRDLQNTQESLQEYKKPRFIFINNLIKPIVINFIPIIADRDQILWFEGNSMKLKASLRCNLPVIKVETYEDLSDHIKKLNKDFQNKWNAAREERKVYEY